MLRVMIPHLPLGPFVVVTTAYRGPSIPLDSGSGRAGGLKAAANTLTRQGAVEKLTDLCTSIDPFQISGVLCGLQRVITGSLTHLVSITPLQICENGPGIWLRRRFEEKEATRLLY